MSVVRIEWMPITKETYTNIRADMVHFGDDQVFGQYTDIDGTSPIGIGKPYLYTKWGINGASVPTVKYERKDNVESFFLAKIIIIDED